MIYDIGGFRKSQKRNRLDHLTRFFVIRVARNEQVAAKFVSAWLTIELKS